MHLFPYQIEGAKFLANRKRALLADDPGIGKSAQALVAAQSILKNHGQLNKKILILCPNCMLKSWRVMSEEWRKLDDVEFHIINWDKLVHKTWQKRILAELSKYYLCIADESHEAVKNPKAVRCKFFMKYMEPHFEYLWFLTATLASKSAADYYCTLKMLRPELPLGKYIDFQETFCDTEPNLFATNGIKYVGFKNKDILKKMFAPVSLRRKKEKVLPDLPPKIFTKVPLELKDYPANKDSGLSYDAISALLDGAAQEDIPEEVRVVAQEVGLAKVPSALEWMESFPEDQSIVIFCWHKSVARALHEGIEDSELITGDTTNKEKDRIKDDFQSGKFKRLVATIASTGVGVTLTAASNCLCVELPWSLFRFVQFQDRIHRIGSTGTSTNYSFLLVENTFDPLLYKNLRSRYKTTEEILG